MTEILQTYLLLIADAGVSVETVATESEVDNEGDNPEGGGPLSPASQSPASPALEQVVVRGSMKT